MKVPGPPTSTFTDKLLYIICLILVVDVDTQKKFS